VWCTVERRPAGAFESVLMRLHRCTVLASWLMAQCMAVSIPCRSSQLLSQLEASVMHVTDVLCHSRRSPPRTSVAGRCPHSLHT